MSQNPLVVADADGAVVRANLNLALDTLNTLNSGPGAPSNPEAYMLWADTGTGYLKQRNSANNAWVCLRPLDPSVDLATNSGNAFSITLAPAITAYQGGVVYKFIPNVSTSGAVTLNINGRGNIVISGAPALTANQPVLLIYDATDGIFLMAGGGGGVPTGAIQAFGGSSAPSGYLLCQGQAVSRATYAALYAILGTTFGSGDGSTTFNLPNLQIKFPLGAGTGYALGATAGALTGPSQGNSLGSTSDSGSVTGALQGTGNVITPTYVYEGITVGGQSIMPPYQVVNYIIKY